MEIDLHTHSRHSNDSRSKVDAMLAKATSLGLGAIAITDHNSLEGAREGALLAKGRILVVPGMELKTDKGDILALFIEEEISSRTYTAAIQEIRSKDGISIVPHPGDSPKMTAEDIRIADGLEVFNSTCGKKSNDQAFNLAKELGKPGFSSSDAHLVSEIGNGRTRVNDCSSLQELKTRILENPTPTMMIRSNPLLHRTNEAVNFGLKGLWRR